MRRRRTTLIGLVALMLVFISATAAGAATEFPAPGPGDLGGSVEARVDGRRLVFPVLKTDIHADIQGDLATVTVTQTFANPADIPLHATYLFPLNKDAAVYAMRMEVGDEIVEAEIRKIEEARRAFDAAKRAGKAASMLTQHRPNMFTQKIANLMPGLPVKVTLQYAQAVPRVDNGYELVVPLVVGPRYQSLKEPGRPSTEDDEPGPEPVVVEADRPEARAGAEFAPWEIEKLPEYPDVDGLTIPQRIDRERVSLTVQINAGLPVGQVSSPTHAIDVRADGADRRHIGLSAGRTIDNRDFVLRYTLSGQGAQAGLLTHRDDRGGFFSLLIEPPELPEEGHITPREMVFVLDCSGSMRGAPLDAAKAFVVKALNGLRAGDYFRIIRFSDSATEFSSRPLSATPPNIRQGLRHIRGLSGQGGTEMSSGIIQALDAPQQPNTIRLVVFLTDGYIGHEATVLGLIHKKIKDARLYAFGVGTSVNRYLLSEMGRMGRGFTRYLDPTEDPDEVTDELALRLQSPVLTDIRIDWGGLKTDQIAPQPIPDLFAGRSIRIQGRYENFGEHVVTIHGRVNGREARLPLKVTFPERTEPGGEAIALIWARERIKEHMRELTRNPQSDSKREVIRLGLEHSLMTRWTSFVAVSRKKVNPNPEASREAQAPLPMVKGVTRSAYPSGGVPTQTASGGGFSGGAVPEPATTAGLLVIGGSAALGFFRRRKARTA